MISITSASTSWDLITVEDLPGGIRGVNSSNDPRLATLIERVSRTIPRHLGRILARQTYQEDVPSYGLQTLRIMDTQTSDGLYPGGPITTVASVLLLNTENSTTNATTTTDYQIQDRMAGELYRAKGWQWTAQNKFDALTPYVQPGSERPLWRVSYTAGFTLPTVGMQSATQAGNLPLDIREAAVEAVTQWWHREQRDPDISRYRMGDVELQYGSASGQFIERGGLAATAVDLLRPWKRVI